MDRSAARRAHDALEVTLRAQCNALVSPPSEDSISAIWDTGDSAWDSTILIDNFRWIADGGTVDVGTNPAG